jgi:predicted phage terminase large subunit-like protein
MIRRVLLNPWIPKIPNPKNPEERGPTEKQMEFLLRENLEILYGGAAGGGKSWALLAGAAMYVDVPNFSAIIFRENLTDLELPEGLIEKSRNWGWREKGAKWNGATYTYSFPSGATISFGYMGSVDAHLRYKSSEYQYIGFDQVEDIPEHQYNYMFSRLRRPEGLNVPLRMRSTANPGGEPWVYEHFVQKETRDPDSLFIPATVDENPYIDLEAYEENLRRLDPITYEQLRHGVWGLSRLGSMFVNKFRLIKQLPYDKPLRGVRYWDLAATEEAEGGEPAYTAGVLMLTSDDGLYYIRDVKRVRLRPLDVENLIQQNAILDKRPVEQGLIRYVDTWMEQEPGSSGKITIDHYTRNVLQGYAFHGDKVTGSKPDRARPFAAAVAAGNVYLIIGKEEGEGKWIQPFINECLAFPEAKYKDQVDAASGAYQKLSDMARRPKFG